MTDTKHPFLCDNCGHEEVDPPHAKDLKDRLDVGGIYTNRECSLCGALTYFRGVIPYGARTRLMPPFSRPKDAPADDRRYFLICPRCGGGLHKCKGMTMTSTKKGDQTIALQAPCEDCGVIVNIHIDEHPEDPVALYTSIQEQPTT